MKTRTKVIITMLTFVLLYGVIMLFAYQYLYPYPKGYVDDLERTDKALNYRQVFATAVDSDTTVYITKSLTSSAYHFGTLDCSWPKYFKNFFCKSTSSVYFPVDSYGYVTTNDSSVSSYLFGATSDMNTVKVVISFTVSATISQDYEMVYADQTFYCTGFDPQYAAYPSTITAYNESGGITFTYTYNTALISGQVFNYTAS